VTRQQEESSARVRGYVGSAVPPEKPTEIAVQTSARVMDQRTYRIWRQGLHWVPPVLIRQETHLFSSLSNPEPTGHAAG
jgi:hypothetical protein